MVMTGPPRSFQPSKGVFRPLDSNRVLSTVTGRSGSRTVRSASAPTAMRPFRARPSRRAGPVGQELDETRERDRPRPDEPVEDEGHGRLQADDAERGRRETAALFLGRVRGVVGGDDVDDARPEGLDQGGRVGGRPQRRVHLEVRVARFERLVGEEEVVGRRLGRDADAAGLGLADHADAAGGREVGDVDAGPGRLGQDDVAGDHDLFRRRGDAGKPSRAETGLR